MYQAKTNQDSAAAPSSPPPGTALEQAPATSVVPESDATAGVSIIIPAYNEGTGLAPVLEQLLAAIDALQPAIPIEVIVVDDGSADETSEVARGFEGNRVRVIRHDENRGYGAAIKTGARQAQHEWIAITDADGTYPPEGLGAILAERRNNEMVVGARTGQVAHIPLIRRPPKWVLRRLASFLVGYNIPDLNSGFRVMRRRDIERYAQILPNQFSFTTTITLALLSDAQPVKYLPINYLKRKGRSKIRPIADTLNFLTLIVRTILYFNPLRIFLPLALVFMLASVGVGVGSVTLLGRFMDVTTVLLFVSGIQVLALGMLADVVNRRSK